MSLTFITCPDYLHLIEWNSRAHRKDTPHIDFFVAIVNILMTYARQITAAKSVFPCVHELGAWQYLPRG